MIIAQSFMKQLKRLPQKEQGVVSRTVLELQADPTAATLSLHKVDGEAGWWSAYANGDLRIILARPGEGELVLCWTDHHNKAYLWAKRHVLAQHPVAQTMQLVEIPEVEAARAGREPYQAADAIGDRGAHGRAGAPRPTQVPSCSRLNVTRDELLAWGVPELWVERVLTARDEDELLDIGEHHLPPDAAEVVLKIAVGERPTTEDPESGRPRTSAPTGAHGVGTTPNGGFDPQVWWVVSADDDLRSALENLDWDAWCVYLHPSQRKIAYRLYSGPYRVCGSAGTGKTVVALHHAKYILEQDAAAQVLVLTYSKDLAKDQGDRDCPQKMIGTVIRRPLRR